jgi:hypothetical protein
VLPAMAESSEKVNYLAMGLLQSIHHGIASKSNSFCSFTTFQKYFETLGINISLWVSSP